MTTIHGYNEFLASCAYEDDAVMRVRGRVSITYHVQQNDAGPLVRLSAKGDLVTWFEIGGITFYLKDRAQLSNLVAQIQAAFKRK